jgi:transcriptional regulator with XRE-family HTH domain
MSDFRNYLNKQLENPDFKKEWDNLEPEFDTIQAIIDARKSSNMTQKELAQKTGIDQADISKIENGIANPALSTLKRLAEGMDMVLKLEFIPKHAK